MPKSKLDAISNGNVFLPVIKGYPGLADLKADTRREVILIRGKFMIHHAEQTVENLYRKGVRIVIARFLRKDFLEAALEREIKCLLLRSDNGITHLCDRITPETVLFFNRAVKMLVAKEPVIEMKNVFLFEGELPGLQEKVGQHALAIAD